MLMNSDLMKTLKCLKVKKIMQLKNMRTKTMKMVTKTMKMMTKMMKIMMIKLNLRK